MAMENDAEPVQLFGLFESVAVTVKMKVPVCVGVPLIVPFEARERFVGNVPPVTANVYGLVPPVAVKLWPRGALPTVRAGNEPPPLRAGVTALLMLTLSEFEAEQPAPFVTTSVR